jgi:hypothetical protein
MAYQNDYCITAESAMTACVEARAAAHAVERDEV